MSNVITSRVLQGLATLVESYGYDASRIAHSVGLEEAALYDDSLMIEGSVLNDMLEECARVCGDRFLCLKLAEHHGLELMGPIWDELKGAGTVAELLQSVVKNMERHVRAMSVYLIAKDDSIAFCLEARRLTARGDIMHRQVEQGVEHSLAVFSLELRGILGDTWRPKYVQLRYAPPSHQGPLRQVFGDNLYFNQDVNAINLDLRDYHQRISSARFKREAGEQNHFDLNTHNTMPLVLKVDRAIRMMINMEGCSAQGLADSLGMNMRTLQYQLQQNKTSYQELYDNARLELARNYLRKSDLSIAAIAERLFFNDCAAFSRFVKAHCGRSPRVYRKDHMDNVRNDIVLSAV